MADTQVIDISKKSTETPQCGSIVKQKRDTSHLDGKRTGRPRKVRLDEADKAAIPLEKKVGSLRYRSVLLAERLSEEIRSVLDSTLPKKDKARLVRELAWSYGVLFDKAAGGESSNLVKIQFPAEVLQAMKIGIALQVAPKSSTDTQPIVSDPQPA